MFPALFSECVQLTIELYVIGDLIGWQQQKYPTTHIHTPKITPGTRFLRKDTLMCKMMACKLIQATITWRVTRIFIEDVSDFYDLTKNTKLV